MVSDSATRPHDVTAEVILDIVTAVRSCPADFVEVEESQPFPHTWDVYIVGYTSGLEA